MSFVYRFRFSKVISPLWTLGNSSAHLCLVPNVRLLITTTPGRRFNLCKARIGRIDYLNYSNKSKKHNIELDKQTETLQYSSNHKEEKLKDIEPNFRQRSEHLIRDIRHQKDVTEQRLREKKEHIVKEILETKAKAKEKIGQFVERENLFTIPNMLCYCRIALSPVLAYFILTDSYCLALGVLGFAGITDLLDGWIARTWKSQSSKLGSFLDPVADKVLIAPLFVTLTIQNLIPLSLTLLIVARDVGIVAAVMVLRYRSLPEPKTLSRYFDMSHATAQLAPTMISKVNTALQLVLVATTLSSPVFGFVDHPAVQALCAVTAATTVASALSYIVTRNTYRMFTKK